MAPLMTFYNGPGSSQFGNIVISYYGTGYTPSFFADGVWDDIGWNQNACESAIDSRLAVPAKVEIDITTGGNADSGVVYYNIIAEEDLQPGSLIRMMSAIVESDITADYTWGNYNGQTVHWIPRMAPIGNPGVTLDFQGPYPETLTVQGEYTIDPDWDYENMGIVAFVFDYDGKEVYNAFYADDLGSILGVEGPDPVLDMTVGPNPSAGTFSVSCELPTGVSGGLEVFDLTGRMLFESETPNTSFSVEESGVYFVRLTTSGGSVVTRSVAVAR